MHLWGMCVLGRMQKGNNLVAKLTIVASKGEAAQTMGGATRGPLWGHILFGGFAKPIPICIGPTTP